MTENESLLLKIQLLHDQIKQQPTVIFNPIIEQRVYERDKLNIPEEEEVNENVVEEDDEDMEGEDKTENNEEGSKAEGNEMAAFRMQGGRVSCIVCGKTRNTRSKMNKHMKEHEASGEVIPPG